MLYNNRIVAAFLERRPVTEEKHLYLLQEYKEVDPKRRGIAQELDSQLESIVGEFLIFNRELFEAVFPSYREQLKTVCIMAVAGTEENRIVKSEEGLCILTDLIYIADYIRVVSQMTYILQNYLTFELSKYLIQEQFPVHPCKYLSLLNHLTFTNGLANYPAWNASCSSYKFYTQKYEVHKERAFDLFPQALQVGTKALQYKTPVSAVIQEFWNQLPSAAGTLYFDDIYRDLGKEGTVLLYRHGPKNFIRTILHERGNDMMIKILSGDITTLQVDVIVNATNVSLLGGDGIDGTTHRAAGLESLEECRTLHGCKTREVKITKGYRPPCPHVIHTPGPIWQGENHGECELLESCYRSCTKLAKEYHITSIAFPVISTDVYYFPLEQAVRIAIWTILEEKETCIKIAYLVCFDEITHQIYEAVRNEYGI